MVLVCIIIQQMYFIKWPNLKMKKMLKISEFLKILLYNSYSVYYQHQSWVKQNQLPRNPLVTSLGSGRQTDAGYFKIKATAVQLS